MQFRWRDIYFEVHCRVQWGRHLIVPWDCVDILVILISSRPEICLSPSMVNIHIREGTRSLLGPDQPVLAFFCCLFCVRGDTSCLVIRTAQVDLAMKIALRFTNYAFYDVEEDFSLDANLMMVKGILIYLPFAVGSNIAILSILNIVRRTEFIATTSIDAFGHLRYQNWSPIDLAISIGWIC